jgi:hypothetical protein
LPRLLSTRARLPILSSVLWCSGLSIFSLKRSDRLCSSSAYSSLPWQRNRDPRKLIVDSGSGC